MLGTWQPQYVDGVKSLPRPLPMAIPVADAHSPGKKEGDNEEEVGTYIFYMLIVIFSFHLFFSHLILYYFFRW